MSLNIKFNLMFNSDMYVIIILSSIILSLIIVVLLAVLSIAKFKTGHISKTPGSIAGRAIHNTQYIVPEDRLLNVYSSADKSDPPAEEDTQLKKKESRINRSPQSYE